MPRALRKYLEDPFLALLYRRVREADSIKSIALDLTHICNLRCKGCYYYGEEMDKGIVTPTDSKFDAFIDSEKERGTNFITVVGGEPSLYVDRLKKLHSNFHINVATNGLVKIPFDGLETMPFGIAIWGSAKADIFLRGGNKIDVFQKALDNYKNDPRAFWYYTVIPGLASEIEGVVERCIDNGNPVLFNFYSDLDRLGPEYDGRRGFGDALEAIDRVIQRFPKQIFLTNYLARTITTGELYGEKWGHHVCTNLSIDHPANTRRFMNGNPYNAHFKIYQADLQTTRRCCNGIERSCDTCFDVWEHFAWIMLNLNKHLNSKEEFTNWLTSMYVFYLINRLVDYDEGIQLLPQIHAAATLAVPVPQT